MFSCAAPKLNMLIIIPHNPFVNHGEFLANPFFAFHIQTKR